MEFNRNDNLAGRAGLPDFKLCRMNYTLLGQVPWLKIKSAAILKVRILASTCGRLIAEQVIHRTCRYAEQLTVGVSIVKGQGLNYVGKICYGTRAIQWRRLKMRSRFAINFLSLILAIPIAAAAQSVPPRKDIPTIARAANGSIVSIVMSDDKGKPIAQGTGFVVSKDGLIVTNYHVIAEGSSAVAKLPDGAIYVLQGVVASDKARDVAVVKAAGQNLRTLALGNSDGVEVLRRFRGTIRPGSSEVVRARNGI
jgi:S1-C subfamily serine protease